MKLQKLITLYTLSVVTMIMSLVFLFIECPLLQKQEAPASSYDSTIFDNSPIIPKQDTLKWITNSDSLDLSTFILNDTTIILDAKFAFTMPTLNMVFYAEDSLMLKISWDSGVVKVKYDSIDAAGKFFFDWLQDYISQDYWLVPKSENGKALSIKDLEWLIKAIQDGGKLKRLSRKSEIDIPFWTIYYESEPLNADIPTYLEWLEKGKKDLEKLKQIGK